MPQPLSHTPGPWGLVFGHAGVILIVALGASRPTAIAAVDGGPEAEPNALLIAAAPAMAAAILANDLTAGRAALAEAGLA